MLLVCERAVTVLEGPFRFMGSLAALGPEPVVLVGAGGSPLRFLVCTEPDSEPLLPELNAAGVRLRGTGAWVLLPLTSTHGGSDLPKRLITASRGLLTLLHDSRGEVDNSLVHPFCVDFDQIARDAGNYFAVPDPQAQSLWQKFTTQVRTAGQDCDHAVDKSNGDLLDASLQELIEAGTTSPSIDARLEAVLRNSGQ